MNFLPDGSASNEIKIFFDFPSWFSLYLGLSDLEVETVFRTTDGFVVPWTNWFAPNPQGNAGLAEGLEDCGGRIHDRQKLGDYGCHHNMMYYCEGNPNK